MDLASRDALLQRAVAGFDAAAVADMLTHCAAAPDSDILWVDVARAWLALMQGNRAQLEPNMASLFARAAASRVPSRVIEVTVLRAMLALSTEQLAEATLFARRASLMARTEALPGAELLANVVLSRLRRHSGKSYLAQRILDSLSRTDAARAAPGWLDWERFLAGSSEVGDAGGPPCAPSARAVAAGRRLLYAARAGSRESFEREAIELDVATEGFVDMQREARALMVLLDPAREGEPQLRGFKRGEHDEPSYGLGGARMLHGETESTISILAVARPNELGSRILADGLGLFGPCRTFFQEGRRVHGRTDTALAVFALFGPRTLPDEEFFQRVYGYNYSHGVHRGALDVLVHRIRQRIGASGVLLRSGGGLSLELREPIAVADPRCSPPASARVLSALSRQPYASAEALAARLGITLRATQMALRELVTDGACSVRRSGRQIQYQVRDTTFSEPTGNDVLK